MSSSIIKGTMLEMTWVEIDEMAKKNAIVLFPVAVVEEHGPHLSVSVDIMFGYQMALEAKKHFDEKGIPAVIAPPFYWGINGTTKKLPGSFYVSNETFTAILTDILMSLKNWGFKKIICIPGHGELDHSRCIDKALKTVFEKTGKGAYLIMSEFMAKRSGIKASDYNLLIDFNDVEEKPGKPIDIHAGFKETSFMLRYFPDHVRAEMLKDLAPTDITIENYELWEEGGDFFNEKTPHGYLGDPASGNAGFGEMMVQAIMQASMPAMEELK